MCEDGGFAKAGSYGRPKQIVVQTLISTRGKAQRRKTKWSNARPAYVSGDTQVTVEIEGTLSFPPSKSIAIVAKVGIATEDYRACFFFAAGWPCSSDLSNKHRR